MKKSIIFIMLNVLLTGCSNEPKVNMDQALSAAHLEILDKQFKKPHYINTTDADILSDLFLSLKATAIPSATPIPFNGRNFSIPVSVSSKTTGVVRFEFEEMTASSYAIYKVIYNTTIKYTSITVGQEKDIDFLMFPVRKISTSDHIFNTAERKAALKDRREDVLLGNSSGKWKMFSLEFKPTE